MATKYKTIYFPQTSPVFIDEFLAARLDDGLELVATSSGFYHFRKIEEQQATPPATVDDCIKHISALRSDGTVFPDELALVEEVVSFINSKQ